MNTLFQVKPMKATRTESRLSTASEVSIVETVEPSVPAPPRRSDSITRLDEIQNYNDEVIAEMSAAERLQSPSPPPLPSPLSISPILDNEVRAKLRSIDPISQNLTVYSIPGTTTCIFSNSHQHIFAPAHFQSNSVCHFLFFRRLRERYRRSLPNQYTK